MDTVGADVEFVGPDAEDADDTDDTMFNRLFGGDG